MDLHAFDGDAVWYAPDIGDNRDKKEENQFAVLIVPMSRQQFRKMEEKHSSVSFSKKGRINPARNVNRMLVSVTETCVTEVVNCTLLVAKTVDGERIEERRSIADGEDLAKWAPDSVLDDILGAVKDQSVLAEGLLGKSAPPSDIST